MDHRYIRNYARKILPWMKIKAHPSAMPGAVCRLSFQAKKHILSLQVRRDPDKILPLKAMIEDVCNHAVALFIKKKNIKGPG